MPNSCFVPGCNSGYISMRKRNKLEGKKNPSIFGAPSDPKTLELWVANIPYKHRPFGCNDGICEYHFTEDCIDRYFRRPLSEADRQCYLRSRVGLKRGSVPTIFTNTTPIEDDLKRKMPKRRSTKVEFIDDNVAETSVNYGSDAGSSWCNSSTAGSSWCDSSAAGSITDENIADPSLYNQRYSKPTQAYEIIEQLTSDGSISDFSHQENEVKPIHDQKFEPANKNIKPSPRDHVPSSSHIDLTELSPPISLLSNDDTSEPLPSKNDIDKPSPPKNEIHKSSQSCKDFQPTEILGSSSAEWSLNDLFNYASSLESLKDDNFTCCRVQSAVILQQWHSSSYHCIKMIIFEENLRPQLFIENERYCGDELKTLNRISSETMLQSLLALVKELKVLPKISDFHLESFYKKMVRQS